MVPVVQLPTLPAPTDDPLSPEAVADLYAARVTWDCTWPEVLAMAVKDRASAVHYHPWRTDRLADFVLSYVITGTRYGLIRPPAAAAGRLLAEARRLLCPSRVRRLTAGRTVVGRLRLAGDAGVSEWCGICWTGAGLSGVEWQRVSPVEASAHARAAEAQRAPDRGGLE